MVKSPLFQSGYLRVQIPSGTPVLTEDQLQQTNFSISRIEIQKDLVWSLRIAGIEKWRLTCLISMVSVGSTPTPASKFTEDRLQQTLKIFYRKK